jgi:phosphopantothenoylcysteine decarboxylase/phosphopantothenate--cysteine ligase
LADDLLGMVALSTRAPLLVAPAMEHGMFHHSATQAHLATLRQRGATVVGPETGRLASGAEGDGRLASARRSSATPGWCWAGTGRLLEGGWW